MDTPVNPGSDGRLPSGRFAPGNKLAKGNPANRRMQEFRRSFLDAIEPETVQAITKKLVALAVAGDLDACKVLLPQLIGRPPQLIDLSGPDVEVAATLRKLAVLSMQFIPPERHADFVDRVRALATESRASQGEEEA
jgi:hypothetical protein